MSALPPGPPPIGLTTPGPLLTYLKESRDIAAMVGRRFERYGDIYSATIRDIPLFVIRRPEHVRQVLQTQGSKFGKPTHGFAARQLKRFLGEGLLNSNGDFWRHQRKLINPGFRRNVLLDHAPHMVNATEQMLQRWSGRQVVDVSEEMMALTLQIVTRALFDHDTSAHGAGHSDTDIVSRGMEGLREAFSSPLHLLPQSVQSWLPIPTFSRVRNGLSTMDAMVFKLIDARTQALDTSTDRSDLLSVLVQMIANNPDGTMSRKQLRDELMTLMLAGHETTSHALTWTFHLLAEHPDIEGLLHHELTQVLGDRSPTASDLPQLPYVDMVLKESMRLYPPAYVISRVAQEPVELGGYQVSEGSEVLVWIYWTHRDPRWFPQPLQFRPERFSAENAPSIPKGAYVPFAAGTRSCIGKHFAMMEAQLILATVLQKFRLSSVPDHPVVPNMAVTMSPKYGMKMRLERR